MLSKLTHRLRRPSLSRAQNARSQNAHESEAQKGYSLLELLVVLAIIGLLVTLVAPRLFNQVDKSKVTAAKAQTRSLKTSLEALRLDMGRFPTEAEGLSLLVRPPSDSGQSSLWRGPYIEEELPLDPWGNAYHYEAPQADPNGFSLSPRVVSYGADGEPGGDNLNADISS